MSAEQIEQAKREAELARERMESTARALQARLNPKVLANDAWDEVRGRGNDIADGAVTAVKKRPAAVSAAAGAVILFLARKPLTRAMTRLVKGREEERQEFVVTKVRRTEPDYEAAVPFMRRPVEEGVS